MSSISDELRRLRAEREHYRHGVLVYRALVRIEIESGWPYTVVNNNAVALVQAWEHVDRRRLEEESR
jgi:hypothetical protein